MTDQPLAALRMGELLDRYPFVATFFSDEGLDTVTD